MRKIFKQHFLDNTVIKRISWLMRLSCLFTNYLTNYLESPYDGLIVKNIKKYIKNSWRQK